MHTDPLFEYEQKHMYRTSKPSFCTLCFRGIKFLTLYLLLSGTIFSFLLGLLNFSAYSARILDWLDPEHLTILQQELSNAIARSSIDVHAQITDHTKQMIESRQIIHDKIADIAPGLIYSRLYTSENLLNHLNEKNIPVTFDVVPYENRIIIPRLGKNIPLIDVAHDIGTSYTQMHEIFMEELKK